MASQSLEDLGFPEAPPGEAAKPKPADSQPKPVEPKLERRREAVGFVAGTRRYEKD